MTEATEDALRLCGPDRVFHNEVQVSVAIRTGNMFCQPDEKWITQKGSSLDEAGALAAKDFAEWVRKEGRRLFEWADSIERSLKRRVVP